MNNFYVEYIFTLRNFFFFFLSRNLARFDFFHPPIYILICMIVKLSALLIESRYVERDNRKRISINKSHVRNFNFFVFYNFPLLILSFETCKTSNLFIKFIRIFIFLSLSFIYRSCNYQNAQQFFEDEQRRVFIFTYILNSTLFSPIIQASFEVKIYLHIYILRFIQFPSVTISSINYQSVWSRTGKRVLKFLRSRRIVHREERVYLLLQATTTKDDFWKNS